MAKFREMLVVRAPRGETHITGLELSGRTACNRKCNGWAVAPVARRPLLAMREGVTCLDCKAKAFLPVRVR